MALEEKRACLWHAFNTLDDQHKGCVFKSKLKVLTHNIANCLGVLKAEEALEKYRSSPTITFQDYIYFLNLKVFSQFKESDEHNVNIDFNKIDEVCWFLCCSQYHSREKKVLRDSDSFKLWQIFNFLAETDSKNVICEPVVVDCEEVDLLVSRFLSAAGLFHDDTQLEEIHAAVGKYDFKHCLHLLETHCCNHMDAVVISCAIDDIYDEYIKDVIKKGQMLKRGHVVTGWKERWFVLTSRSLCYYTSRDLKDMKGEISVNPGCQAEAVPDKPNGKPHCFHFVTLSRTYEISCPDLRTRNEWVNALKSAIDSCQKGQSLQQQALKKRKITRDARRAKLQEEEEARKKDNELMEKTKQALEEEKQISLKRKEELETEKKLRVNAEALAVEEATLKDAERKRREELEALQLELEHLLEEERQAKRDEEIVRNLQAKILEEEFQKREELERLKSEQEAALKEERQKRAELEELRENQEHLLTEQRQKLEQMVAAKMSAEEQRQQLEMLKARHEEMLAEERKRREELEEMRQCQEDALKAEHIHLEQLQVDRKAADDKLQEALLKLQEAERAKAQLKAKVKERERPIGLNRLITPEPNPLITHRGVGAFVHSEFEIRRQLIKGPSQENEQQATDLGFVNQDVNEEKLSGEKCAVLCSLNGDAPVVVAPIEQGNGNINDDNGCEYREVL